MMRCRQILVVLALPLWLLLAGCATPGGGGGIARTHVRSPEFRVAEADVDYFKTYTGFNHVEAANGANGRFFEENIEPKMLDMIARAERHVILSVFLFDSLYAAGEVERDVVGTLSDALIDKKLAHPEISIAVILDPSHRSYGRRVSPVERRFREVGIDVFYSDLIGGLKKAGPIGVREALGHANRLIDQVTFKTWSRLWSGAFSLAKLPFRFDGELVTVEAVYNALLMKANHRKLFLTDTGDGDYEVLVSSANPHNASAFHVNSAVSVRGAPARFAYNVLRADLAQSARLGGLFAHWHYAADRAYRKGFLTERFPELPVGGSTSASAEHPVGVRFVTEIAVQEAVLEMLAGAAAGDEIRIQMFYISRKPVVRAILAAAERTGRPVRLLLDANKDSFNTEKDGTPNRQVARHLMRQAAARGIDLQVRWYATHGEQNHTKTMSISNPERGQYLLTTGSCNWTGRNMDGVNMEANIVLSGARAATESFNYYFDLFWSNSDGNMYSLDYAAFGEDQTGGDWKWHIGEKPFYFSSF